MESTQKDALVSILNINLKINNKDIACVEDINNLLLATIDESEKSFIVNNLMERLLTLAESDYNFAETVISNTTFENKVYLLTRIKGFNIMRNISKYNVANYVITALNTVYPNITPNQEFGLYQVLVRLAITEGSPELIKLTIDKIQSL